MDFFARQAATRRQSRWMVFLFVLAVVAIVVAIDFVVVTTVAILSVQDDGGLLASPGHVAVALPARRRCSRSIVVLGTIGISSLARTVSLAAGGGKVAEQLGGTRVGADTTDPLKRRLRNVVEEMAIASGVPVPQVYVLEREAGINAFAAGLQSGERRDRGHARRAREPRTATSCRA